jgi:hypothetical protein
VHRPPPGRKTLRRTPDRRRLQAHQPPPHLPRPGQALAPELLWPQIDAIEAAIQRQDVAAGVEVLAALVPEWMRGDGVGEAAAASAIVI